MNKKYWVFVYKLPDVGYSVRLSDDLMYKMKELELPCLECITMNGMVMLKANGHLGMYLRIKTGPRAGNYKNTLNYKLLHVKLANRDYFPEDELLEEAYGYRLNLEWHEEYNTFTIIK